MNFNGRWVPPELMNLILMLWLIAAVMIGVWLFRMRVKAKRQSPPERRSSNTPRRQGTRGGRKKR